MRNDNILKIKIPNFKFQVPGLWFTVFPSISIYINLINPINPINLINLLQSASRYFYVFQIFKLVED